MMKKYEAEQIKLELERILKNINKTEEDFNDKMDNLDIQSLLLDQEVLSPWKDGEL